LRDGDPERSLGMPLLQMLDSKAITQGEDRKCGLRSHPVLKEIVMKPRVFSFALFIAILAWQTFSYAGILGNSDTMDMIYKDESHCLVEPELRGNQDNPIACYCRDAIMDARYVYEDYLLTGKDRNLNGAYVTLKDRAQQTCGEHYDVAKAIETKDWQWSGPEVTREYPPEKEINQIQPDTQGFRTVEYKVHLTYRDSAGQVTKVENYTALDKLSPNTRK
jgi:hypothetical protein